MSGKRIWNGTYEEYRVLHEQEMRQRFMQTYIPGIDAPADRPVMASSLMPATLQVVRNWPEATGGKVWSRFEGFITAAKAPAMWFQRVARGLARRLERAGFRLTAYDAGQTAVTMRRGAEKVTIMLIEAAPISTISGARLEEADGQGFERSDDGIEEINIAGDDRSDDHRARVRNGV